jgi:hypothetical protein
VSFARLVQEPVKLPKTTVLKKMHLLRHLINLLQGFISQNNKSVYYASFSTQTIVLKGCCESKKFEHSSLANELFTRFYTIEQFSSATAICGLWQATAN